MGIQIYSLSIHLIRLRGSRWLTTCECPREAHVTGCTCGPNGEPNRRLLYQPAVLTIIMLFTKPTLGGWGLTGIFHLSPRSGIWRRSSNMWRHSWVCDTTHGYVAPLLGMWRHSWVCGPTHGHIASSRCVAPLMDTWRHLLMELRHFPALRGVSTCASALASTFASASSIDSVVF